MEASLQAVLLFHNHQATTPNVPFTGVGTTATGASAPAQPPLRKRENDEPPFDDEDDDKDKDDKEKEDGEERRD